MTANELADELISSLTMEYDCDKYMEQASIMLRQQEAALLAEQEHNEMLMAEIEALKKELALQKLSDIGQEIENEPVAHELQTLVKSFFEDYLDYQEESDSGRVFNPIHVSCTRVMMIEPLAKLLGRMKELSGVSDGA